MLPMALGTGVIGSLAQGDLRISYSNYSFSNDHLWGLSVPSVNAQYKATYRIGWPNHTAHIFI